ncbi:MAG: phosphotransferase [Deltaproteobacteria bacterium]|nr:phosphotransferase [Deltaproteobacteria bacterium]
MLLVRLPEGYVDLDRGRWRVIAARLELSEMVTLLDSARAGTLVGEEAGSGRGGSLRVVLRGGKVVYVRRYLRGGAMRHLVRDLYLIRPPRPIRELMATEQARAAGCRVPIVHAVAIEETGPFYRGWIVTSAIEAARSFIDALGDADEARRRTLLLAAGTAIRDLHAAGVYHVDLNGHNLLVDGHDRVAVIDFDRAVLAPPHNHRLGERGRDRLWRSLTKLAAQRGLELPDEDKRWIERGYER